ncbi:MAG: SAM-dependent methyltransferase [Anaerolineae bacterium]
MDNIPLTLSVLFFGFLLLWVLTCISLLWTAPAGAPWLPTSRKHVRRMLTLAGVQPGEVVCDLGSGDGRVLFIAAREFGARAVGIELDPLRYLWTQAWITLLGLRGQVRVIRGNFFTQDISGADVVTVYLLQKTNIRLRRKLWDELRPGARIVSSVFIFPGIAPAHIDKEAHLYLYRL